MSAVLEQALRAAWAAPLGAHPGQVFHAPFVTVLLAEQQGGEASALALALARDLLARCGVSPGRQMVLLASPRSPGPGARESARALRARLGLPVLLHDPDRSPSMPAGPEPEFGIELDDELREAEAVMVVSAVRRGAAFGDGGGEELLMPGAASAASAARGRAIAADADGRARLARAAAQLCRIDYALLWDADDPARAWAGEPPAVFEAARRAVAVEPL